MNQNEIDLLNFENELLRTRKKLNDLIYQCSHSEQPPEQNKSCGQESETEDIQPGQFHRVGQIGKHECGKDNQADKYQHRGKYAHKTFVFVRYLSRLKSLIFHIIGQLGILIATILGTSLCVYDADAEQEQNHGYGLRRR